MDLIAVLIPCYNEEQTIEKVVRDFRASLPEAAVYVYDNNSTDATAELAEKAGAIVRHEYKQGKGNVIRRMFREIDACCYVMVDGDGTYPAESARALVEPVLARNADMVVGDRLSSTYFVENKRPFHNVGNLLVRKSINWLFKCDIRDIMTGYRAFSYEFVKTFPILSRGFEIETEISIFAAQMNLSIENVVVRYCDRPKGSVSKLNTFSDGFKVLRTIVRLFRTYRPLAFFGYGASLLFVVSAAFFIPVFANYLKTGQVPHFPTLIVCGFTALAGLLSLFSGLMLQTMALKNRQDFEMRLIQVSREKRTSRLPPGPANGKPLQCECAPKA